MAVTKIWKVVKRMDHVIGYAKDENKTKIEFNQKYEILVDDLQNVIDYARNSDKTEKEYFVTGINCDTDSAYEEMQDTKRYYNKKDKILAFHAYQSFAEGEVTPELAHQIGVQLANEMWGDRFQVVVTTHLNTNHIHNHIVLNSVSFEDGLKYYDNHTNYAKMRHISDELCKEYGLSVIEEKATKKKMNYDNFYKKSLYTDNYSNNAKRDLDLAIRQAYSYDDFLYLMKKLDYEIIFRSNKISIRKEPYKRNIRIERRYGENPSEEILKRAEYEIGIIKKMGYVDYYLIVWDFIHYAKSHGIPVGPGRGSGAGSILAYAIEITDIDPMKYGLLFERFLNPERISMPDFDVDFADVDRQKVIDYVSDKYGADHVSQIITFGTMAAKMVIRDAARVLDFPYAEADKLAKMIPNELHITIPKAMEQNKELKDLYDNDEQIHKLLDIAIALEGMPRQASTHACGVVITKDPVDTYVPLYVRDGQISTQYIMTTLEELGLLKMDFLGLRTLTVIKDTINLVKENRGIDVEFDKDMSDPKVYKLWQEGNTSGIFQFESQGMTNFMKELKPDCLEDLIAGVSLYRPGPMDQIPRYIKGKQNPGHNEYTHPSLEPILNVTYGCMVYQEQVMQIVRDLAGYSLGRADLVRRAMGKKKLDVMAKEREVFINGQVDENGNIEVPGCVRNGIDAESANKIFDEMAEFAKYAFNKSHAACYAVVAYRTAYLKAYYPAEFMASMLNSYLGNLDKVPDYIDECKKLGIEILKPDINRSYTKFTVEDYNASMQKLGKIRFGLGSIKNVGIQPVENIIKDRNANGPFTSFTDFCERMAGEAVNKKCIESLIKAGTFSEFPETRATLLASFETIIDTIQSYNKKGMNGQVSMFDLGGNDEENNLNEIKYNFSEQPELNERELLSIEKEMLGIYVSGHPLEKIREQIIASTNISSIQMKEIDEINSIGPDGENAEDVRAKSANKFVDGQDVKIAGIISSVKKKYTKNNKIMVFLTIEDLYGSAEIIVFEPTYLKSQDVLVEENIVMIDGRLSIREDDATKIVAKEIKNFGEAKPKMLTLNITNTTEEQKAKLRGAIKFFNGEQNNISVAIKIGDDLKSCGAIYLTDEILQVFAEIIGKENCII